LVRPESENVIFADGLSRLLRIFEFVVFRICWFKAFDDRVLRQWRIKQLTVRGVLADLSLAALSSVVTVLGTVAFAAMVFSGSLANVVPLVFLAFLTGTALCGLLIGLFSRFLLQSERGSGRASSHLGDFRRRLGQHGPD